MKHSQPIQVLSEEALQQFGVRLAAQLQIGDLIILEGPLGAGKTRLAQSIGKGLDISTAITSPTFVIAKNYFGKLPLVHVDAYRLLDAPATSLQDLDLDLENTVTIVEWGSDFAAQLNDQYLLIMISIVNENERKLTITSTGERWECLQI